MLANKADVAGSMTVAEVEAALDLGGVRPSAMKVFSLSAMPGSCDAARSAELAAQLELAMGWMAKALR